MNRTLGLLRWHWEHPGGFVWGGSPEQNALGRIEAMRLLAALPSHLAGALRMRIGYGATCIEAARAAGVTRGAVSYRCGRAMLKLGYLGKD